jgi:hypothetical protein
MGCGKPPQLVGAGGKAWPTDVVTINFGDDKIVFYRHPELFITPSVRFWFKIYSKEYAKKKVEDVHNCWDQCTELYEAYIERFKRG